MTNLEMTDEDNRGQVRVDNPQRKKLKGKTNLEIQLKRKKQKKKSKINNYTFTRHLTSNPLLGMMHIQF